MQYKIVFSDVDGTLLDSDHKVLPGTLVAIKALQAKDIPFVIISARSPSGIYPILRENGFSCPIVSYSGGLAIDSDGKNIYSTGFDRETGRTVIDFIEQENMDCSWNIYSCDTWIVKSKEDPRIIREENIVHSQAISGNIDDIAEGEEIHKIMCMCNPDKIIEIEEKIKSRFPEMSIAKSSDILIEIMQAGITKKYAVEKVCEAWDIDLDSTVAFGDNYNDVEMLETVAMPFLMGNAPDELKKRFAHITDDNDSEGIANALKKLGMIQ